MHKNLIFFSAVRSIDRHKRCYDGKSAIGNDVSWELSFDVFWLLRQWPEIGDEHDQYNYGFVESVQWLNANSQCNATK